MTPEEMQAAIDDLKGQVEATNAKNRELLATNSKLKKQSSEVDLEAYHKAIDRVDALESELSKKEGVIKTIQKDFEKVSGQLAEESKINHKLLVSDGITKELAALKIDDFETFLPLFERNATVENGVALVNGKPVKESIAEWANGAGKRYIPAEVNTGGGSQGGSQGGGEKKPQTFKERQKAQFTK